MGASDGAASGLGAGPAPPSPPDETPPPNCGAAAITNVPNFLDQIRSREARNATVEVGRRTHAVRGMVMQSLYQGRRIEYDPPTGATKIARRGRKTRSGKSLTQADACAPGAVSELPPAQALACVAVFSRPPGTGMPEARTWARPRAPGRRPHWRTQCLGLTPKHRQSQSLYPSQQSAQFAPQPLQILFIVVEMRRNPKVAVPGRNQHPPALQLPGQRPRIGPLKPRRHNR